MLRFHRHATHCQPKAWRGRLAARLEQHLTIHTGAMLHTTEVIHTADEKRALFERTGALASLNRAAGIAGLSISRGE
ncbi:MAG: hypothetical protein M3436_17640 [Pseudomonadota bacterium]|nr:hypothetical protein [Pseudomonadota bacterium]